MAYEVVLLPTHIDAVQFTDRRMLRASIQQIVESAKTHPSLYALALKSDHSWADVRTHRLNIEGIPLRLISGYDLLISRYVHRLDVGYREDLQ